MSKTGMRLGRADNAVNRKSARLFVQSCNNCKLHPTLNKAGQSADAGFRFFGGFVETLLALISVTSLGKRPISSFDDWGGTKNARDTSLDRSN